MKKVTEGKQKKVAAFFNNPFKALDMEVIFRKAIRRTGVDLVDIQQEQMYEGLDANGQPIQPAYTPFTIAIKKTKGQPTDRVTLKDTGSFYRKQFARFHADHAVIDSKDKKTAELKQKYGEDIFGLNDSRREEFGNLLRWDLQVIFEEAFKRQKKS